MKGINETELEVTLDKLETIRQIAEECSEDTENVLMKLAMSAILEVIDE